MRHCYATAVLLPILVATTSHAQPTQGAGDVPRAIYISLQDGEFRKMDADKNGQITRAEVEAFQRLSAKATAEARNRQLFLELDADRNGQLSPAEFGKAIAPIAAANGQPMIAQFDLNKDGRISLIEHRAGKLAIFDRIDTDKDGTVTVIELKAAGVIR